METPAIAALDAARLPPGIRSRTRPGVNGLAMHLLEAGAPSRPCVLLLHGFPELAFSWRHVMPALADAGFHVVAPDLRGYGRTTGWDDDYDGDLRPFRMLNYVKDMLALVRALGLASVKAVIGHDYGSPVAANCALIRPDVFRSVVLMSAPYGGPPQLSTGGAPVATPQVPGDIHAAMAALARPRKHYQWYYSTRAANADMMGCAQGLHAFLRGYYHHKSADWAANKPRRLAGWTADELAQMPTYYIMDQARTMPETVAPEMPAPEAIAANRWLSEADLATYAGEYGRTGFQGGLQCYRAGTSGLSAQDLQVFAGRAIEVPAAFIAGSSDWGIHQKAGDFERMQSGACARLEGVHLIDGAGHWVQQEQAEPVARLLTEFLTRRR
ncbi:MAG TPA: alpha/beta hydrolase [Roseomonas sp.]|jgi:pimeloyl-ACP methyl ester carboxylesterase